MQKPFEFRYPGTYQTKHVLTTRNKTPVNPIIVITAVTYSIIESLLQLDLCNGTYNGWIEFLIFMLIIDGIIKVVLN